MLNKNPIRARRALTLAALGTLGAGLVIAAVMWFGGGDPKQTFDTGLAAYRNNDMEQLSMAQEDLAVQAEYQSHAHLLRGLLLQQAGKPREAIEELGQAIDHADTAALALSYTGQILHSMKDYEAAERLLLAAVAADPKLVDAHRYLIALYYDIGAMDNAIKHCDRVIELAPEDMRPWRLSGLILKDFEKYDEAIEAYLAALKLSPSPTVEREIRQELAECYFQVRKQEEALAELKQLPETPETLSLAADCYLSLGKNDEANASLQKALAADPANLRALTIQASLLMESGDKQRALAALEHAVEMQPTDFNLRSMLMQVYQQSGETEKADQQQAQMKRLRELKDKFTSLHIQSIQQPRDVEARVELARTARQLGMTEAAASWYQAALAMQPNHPAAAAELRELLASQDSAH